MHITPVQTSILLSENFILLTIRSSGFRSYPSDYERLDFDYINYNTKHNREFAFSYSLSLRLPFVNLAT